MHPFQFAKPADTRSAIEYLGDSNTSRFLGGGTNLVDLMRENIEQPSTLVDVSRLSRDIIENADGSLWIGAAAKNTAVASNMLVRDCLPMLSRAILSGATAQIRNLATVGGNLLQRTRCLYFYDQSARCNKREPGTGCDAIDGFNRMHAIFGTSPSCIATHPSDMCVALTALDAKVHVEGKAGSRVIPIGEFHRLPGDTPHVETNLMAGELITAVEIPKSPQRVTSTYRKIRDRSSYAFALVSVAAELRVEEGVIQHVRLALGGVAHRPWRAHAAENILLGARWSLETVQAAAQAELSSAIGYRDNTFKIGLARHAVLATLSSIGGAF
jgi:xanthine dehydrogenase YagS FAD-binding subunit